MPYNSESESRLPNRPPICWDSELWLRLLHRNVDCKHILPTKFNANTLILVHTKHRKVVIGISLQVLKWNHVWSRLLVEYACTVNLSVLPDEELLTCSSESRYGVRVCSSPSTIKTLCKLPLRSRYTLFITLQAGNA